MTTETSNARGEWPERYACNGPEGTFWTDDAALANKLIAAAFDRDEWTVTDTQNPTAAAPPPAAARGDVRGLVDVVSDLRHSTMVDGYERGQVAFLNSIADRIESALAAEGAQAGEVGGDAVARPIAAMFRYSNRRIWEFTDDIASADAGQALMESHGLHSETVYLYAAPPATPDPPQQPEARGVVDDDAVERGCIHAERDWGLYSDGQRNFRRAEMRELLTAALTGERNG